MSLWQFKGQLKKSIEYVSIIEIGFLYRWAILEKRPNHVVSTTSDNQHKWLTSIWQSQVFSLYRFMSRQHVYNLEKRSGDCLMKWLIMLGFTDLRGPRVCRRSTPVLFKFKILKFTANVMFSCQIGFIWTKYIAIIYTMNIPCRSDHWMDIARKLLHYWYGSWEHDGWVPYWINSYCP